MLEDCDNLSFQGMIVKQRIQAKSSVREKNAERFSEGGQGREVFSMSALSNQTEVEGGRYGWVSNHYRLILEG